MTPNVVKLTVLAGMLAALSACEEGFEFPGGDRPETGDEGAQTIAPTSTRLVERDVESPEVFQKSEAGLWDGRPSLGGVWVAHPDVTDPERVIIRNDVNKKFVIGALFRRERDNPGPRFQVSSDAAEALGMVAGQPVKVNVTALRREEVAETPPAPTEAAIEKPEEIEALSLDAPSPEAPDAGITAAAVNAPAAPEPAAPPPARTSNIKNPLIQIGIFSVQANADNTATALRSAGMIPTVRKESTKGKTFYRVVVGPAATNTERAALLKKVKALGFNDAYFTSN
ncbi:SPOR domain-containing protein [Oceaniglobus ichthyenteri]|uniref:SPOR domain-containing protein n=1 Tax=Oceaniglobus ichthyenteri TaxID=2136177 RepID=UPI000D3D612C|nr:SPOR domain-containing protein [Oceaniglobus ichthyenteri]